MKTSPRTSSRSGRSAPRSVCGTTPIVATLGVTSSPTCPSPRVAARDEPAALVEQGDRKAVELRLAHERDRARHESLETGVPRGEVLTTEGVVEREHGDDVGHRGKGRRRRRADFGERRSGPQRREPLLELLALADQLVELGVGDLGIVVAVVALAVIPDQARELLGASRDIGRYVVRPGGLGGRGHRRNLPTAVTHTSYGCQVVVVPDVVVVVDDVVVVPRVVLGMVTTDVGGRVVVVVVLVELDVVGAVVVATAVVEVDDDVTMPVEVVLRDG